MTYFEFLHKMAKAKQMDKVEWFKTESGALAYQICEFNKHFPRYVINNYGIPMKINHESLLLEDGYLLIDVDWNEAEIWLIYKLLDNLDIFYYKAVPKSYTEVDQLFEILEAQEWSFIST